MKYIEVIELIQHLEIYSDLMVIDVRSVDEYKIAHIPCARSLPLNIILDYPARCLGEIKSFFKPEETLYVVCLSDRRSGIACQRLAEMGIYNTCVVKGGTRAWIAEGLPTVSDV